VSNCNELFLFFPLIYPLHKHKPNACIHKHKANVFINILVWKSLHIQNNYTSLRSLSIRAIPWLIEWICIFSFARSNCFPLASNYQAEEAASPASLAKLKCKNWDMGRRNFCFLWVKFRQILNWKIWFFDLNKGFFMGKNGANSPDFLK